MIKKKIKYGLLATILSATIICFLPTNRIALSADTYQGKNCYTSPSSVPQEQTEGGLTYVLKEVKAYNYKSPRHTFVQRDTCRWNLSTVTMDFVSSSGWAWSQRPNFNRVTTTVGSRSYTFDCNVYTHRIRTTLTSYFPNGGLVYSDYGGYALRYVSSYWHDKVSYNGGAVQTSVVNGGNWVGPTNVVDGSTYNTANHDYEYWFTQTIYYGVYEIAKSNPDLTGKSIDGAVYKNGSVNWYKLNESGTSVSMQQIYKDKYHNIDTVNTTLKYGSSTVVSTSTKYPSFDSSNSSLNSSYVSSASGTKIDGSGKLIRTKFNMTLLKSGIYEVYTSAMNLAGYWQNPSQSASTPISMGIIGMDEAAPSYSDINIEDGNIDSCNFTITGVKDYADNSSSISGSGVKEVKVSLYPISASSGSSDTWTTGSYSSSTNTVTINAKFSSKYNNIYGKYHAEILFTDNVGNETKVEKEILRADPTPHEVIADLLNWDYKSDNKCWIKGGHTANFKVTAKSTKEYSSLDYGYPTKISFKLGDINGIAKEGSFSNNFSAAKGLSLVSDSSSKYQSGLYKYLQTNFTVKGEDLGNNKGFLITAQGITELNGTEFASKWISEKDGEYLYVDSKAPVYSNKSLNRQLDYWEITFNGVKDNESGLKSITSKVWIEDTNGNKLYEKSVPLTKVNSTQYKLKVNKSDFNNTKKRFRYEITLIDNVGNISTITNKYGDFINMLCYNLTADAIDIFD